jgi:hypothetical protein
MEVSRQKAFIFFEKRFYSWTEGGNWDFDIGVKHDIMTQNRLQGFWLRFLTTDA